MAIYTVHVPDEAADALARADRTVFVREGFSLRAFVFGFFYLLWHRAWIAGAVWAVLVAAAVATWLVLHPPAFLLVALLGLMHLYLGAEGPDLARWSLARHGRPMQDLVSAGSLAEAEAVYFVRQTAQPAGSPTRPVPRAPAPLPRLPAVIGYPDPGAP